MTYPTMQYEPAKRTRLLRPAFGFAAVVATAATLGLAVVAPAAVAPAEPLVQAHVNPQHLILGPTEVAILPARIQVVASRTRSASAPSPYVPATYRPRS